MFKRKDQELISINDGEGYFVDKAVREYIYKLRSELLEAREKESKLQSALDEILPVLEKQELKPAIGLYCGHCIYCVTSQYNWRILGCCKDVVCEDFKPQE